MKWRHASNENGTILKKLKTAEHFSLLGFIYKDLKEEKYKQTQWSVRSDLVGRLNQIVTMSLKPALMTNISGVGNTGARYELVL